MRSDDEAHERSPRRSASLRILLAVALSIPVVVMAPPFIGLASFGGDAAEVLIAVGIVIALLAMIWLVCT